MHLQCAKGSGQRGHLSDGMKEDIKKPRQKNYCTEAKAGDLERTTWIHAWALHLAVL